MPRKSIDQVNHRSLAYLRALNGFSQIAGSISPMGRLLHHAAAQVSRVTHIERVKVMRYRPHRADLLVEAGVGWKPGVVGELTLSIDHASPAGRALQTGAPVMIEDLPNDPEFRLPGVLRDHGIVSVLNVPVPVGGRTWGVLEVDSAEPRTFDGNDITFLASFANILGLALMKHETLQEVTEAKAEHSRQNARRDALTRELHHRVKNNFQVIISFLSMQRREVENEDVRRRFESVMERVHAIALAHDQLRLEDDGNDVEFGTYLTSLCANINPRLQNVTVEVIAASASVPLHRAVLAGLIVNELVTNCLKYAFDSEGGTIRITFDADETTGEGCIAVEDDGRGMAEARGSGTGLKLVDAFAQQLSGRVERDEVPKGTRIRACFPLVL